MTDDYSATKGLFHLVLNINNGAAEGTGIMPLVTFAQNLIGTQLPNEIVTYSVGTLNNLFGGYPTHKDFAPSIVFTVLFGVFTIIHTIILCINTSRGHYFYLSYVWICYSIMKFLGFLLRALWSTDILKIKFGLASEVFLIVSTFIIVSANLILAQRLFTWRHPVGGSRKLFWGFMFATYGMVLVVIAITILASFVPYLYYLSEKSYLSWVKTVQFTSVLILAYCLTSVALIGLSFWLPTKKDESRYTYQPWWIESFAPFYFVKKGAAQEAETTFMKRNSNHRHATRVIAATHHHFKMVKGLSTERGDLKHNVSMGLLIISTVLTLFGSIVRAIVVFQAREHKFASPAESIWFGYLCWGVFESIISILYIVCRVDLRFYRPDILPQAVRAIITAQQSYYPSDDESGDNDDNHNYKSEIIDKPEPQQQHVYAKHIGGFRGDEKSVVDEDEFDDIDFDEWDFGEVKKDRTNTSSDQSFVNSSSHWEKGRAHPTQIQSSKSVKYQDTKEPDMEFQF
ncbi:hypothetical protein MG5_02093 [Candida albicans P57072]|uniref:Uncharacterized protein n=1 Tax=Candida albicans P78048 TaxID=1094989 RepID=A0AB34PUI4_CANAX|nr:hypothetical protein MG1_02124 [Candida albicans GC75]KGR11550.1 hypothetical protein MG5_02093 [Candida albicans P57072]KGR13680.1 hypothetical protein MG3_02110 [Candida albicans P78048]KGU11002.1 hypothetical protein MEQ_02078 [Candida albicans P87]KGU13784.1 hypothetical protein MEY_02107 [Candida albicans 19F]KGU32785.1 hypothetical protein MGM_02143 [Candida albicans P75063]KHC38300.1 hypothetical protein MGO_02077 [Candida albicans P76055]KHC39742.1 hypothetical protein MGQ_02089 [